MNATGRISRKRQQTRDRIGQVAHALFERHGFDAVTMEQIATEADIARGTLYNHFPVKEAVLVHWLHGQLSSNLEDLMREARARPGFVARVATVLEASAEWWQAHRQYAAPYVRHRFQGLRDERSGEPSSEMITVYALLIADAQATGQLRTDLSADRLAHYLHFLSLCALLAWLGDPDVSLSDEFTRALEFFIDGAAPRGGTPRSGAVPSGRATGG